MVLTGLETRHHSYAQATANLDTTEDAPQEELLTLEQQVMGFLHSKNRNIQSDAISVCHTLPRKTDKAKPTIIITFISRKQRNDVLMQAKKLEGTNVFLNEHLIQKKLSQQHGPKMAMYGLENKKGYRPRGYETSKN